MSETLLTLVNSSRNLLSETGTKFFDPAAMTSHVNRAQDLLFSDAPWVFATASARKTIPGCPSYLLPARMVIPQATFVRTSAGIPYRLTYWPPAIMDQRRQYSGKRTSANLEMCTYRVNELGTFVDLVFDPAGRYDLIVYGYQTPVRLVNDTDISDVPGWASPLIAQRVYLEAKKMDEENAQVQQGLIEYHDMLRDVRARRMRRQMDQQNITRPYKGFTSGRFPWIG